MGGEVWVTWRRVWIGTLYCALCILSAALFSARSGADAVLGWQFGVAQPSAAAGGESAADGRRRGEFSGRVLISRRLRHSASLSTSSTLPSVASKTFIFVGGLQRSGTTWLEGLFSTPSTSALSFENIDRRRYETDKPWLLGNHSRDYFELVTRFGGVEGKFVQDVYPYMYVIDDMGRLGKRVGSQIPSMALLGRATRNRHRISIVNSIRSIYFSA